MVNAPSTAAYPQLQSRAKKLTCGNGRSVRSYGSPLCRDTPFTRMMKRHFSLNISHRSRCRDILQRLAKEGGYSLADIISQSRSAEVVAVRERCYLLMFQAGYSYSHIGRVMNRHHSTVMFAVRKVLGPSRISEIRRSEEDPRSGSSEAWV